MYKPPLAGSPRSSFLHQAQHARAGEHLTGDVNRSTFAGMTVFEPTTPTQAPPHTGVPPGLPPHNVGWAVAALLFFWPLSFSAFIHAFNVYPLWVAGNFAGAQHASDRVRRLGQLSLWIAGALLVLLVIFYVVFLMVLFSHGGDWDHHHRYLD